MTSLQEIGPGTRLDGFVIEAVAGRGGMGVVYRARQDQPERIVALKVISAELGDDPVFVARFKREATIAAQIEHPNVIPVYAVGEAGGVFYLAMRFVDGVDLRALLAQEGRLGPGRSAQIIDQVAQALDAAHARGLVHRDVKPANILLSTTHGREHVYLSDFGLSRHFQASSGLTGSGAFLGTIDYVAPEQARGDPVDARTDVYSLACVLFQALTGTVPYPLENDVAKLYAHDARPPPSVLERARDIPAAFEVVLARGMAKAPDDRYPSAGDLGRAAVAAASGEMLPDEERSVAAGAAAPRTAPATTLQSPTSTRARAKLPPQVRRPVIIGVLVACMAIAAVVVALAVGSRPHAAAANGGAALGSRVTASGDTAGTGHLVVVAIRRLHTANHTYRLVLSTAPRPATTVANGRAPHYFTLWVRQSGGPFLQVQRLRLPWRFTVTSTITQFALTPNGDGSANVSLSWLIGGGNTNDVTHYLTLTPSGIIVDS